MLSPAPNPASDQPAMTDGPLTAEARSALRELTRLVADRAEREARVELARSEALAGAHAREQQAAADRAARHEAESTRITTEHARAIADAGQRHAYEHARATTEAQRRRATVEERAEIDSAALQKRLDEAVWMAETVHDSESPRPGQAYERVRLATSGLLGQLATVDQQAAALCAQWRMPWHPPAHPAPTTHAASAEQAALDSDTTQTADVALAELRLAADDAVRAADRALSAPLPRLFIVPLPEALALGAGIAAGLAAGALLAWAPAAWLSAGLVGTAAAGGGLLALHRAARYTLHHRLNDAAARSAAARALARDTLALAARERDRAALAVRAKRDSTIAAARTAAAASTDELKAIRTRHRSETSDALAAALAAADRARDEAVAAANRARDQSAAALAQWLATQTAADQAAHALALSTAESTHARERADLERTWHTGTRAAADTLTRGTADAARPFPPWNAPAWSGLSTDGHGDWPQPGPYPRAFPVGTQAATLSAMRGGLSSDPRLALVCPDTLPLPLTLELPDRCSLLVQFGGGGTKDAASLPQARHAALDTLRNTALRLLTGLPPGKVRFTFIDPVGLGQSFAAFMHLADHNEQLVGERIWTEPRHIEARLTDLTEHMENVIQKYLRNQFATIEDYNTHAGEVAEPYRFLVLADAPQGLNEGAAKRLASIIAAGPRCGVYTLIAQDLRHALPAGLMQADLDQSCVRLAWKRHAPADPAPRWVRTDPDFAPWPVALEAPPPDERFNAIVHAAGRRAATAGRVEVPFEMIAPPEGRAWTASTAREVSIPVGRAGATKLQHLVLGRSTAQHALIAGRTGSGKSTLLHALIVSGALWHAPSELEFYLVDFKKGVEFKAYAQHALPHARVVAVESEREFGLSVLRRLDGELKARGDHFRSAGAQDVAAFRAARPGHPMPRVLLVVDEFQELFVEDDKIAQESALLLDRLVRQGRAFGMHVVLGSQTLGGAYSLARSTIGQMGVRIALACNEADALLIMGDDNTAARLLSRPGEAIYNDASGAVEANNPFQVAWLSDARRTDLLGAIAARAARDGLPPRPAPIVFEGSSAASLARNPSLAAARARITAPQPPPTPAAPLIWLGDPVAIKDPTAFALRRQSGGNLLILGQRDQTALALAIAALASLGAQGVRGSDISILDGTPADAPPDLAGALARAAATLTPGARLVAYRDTAAAMAELTAEVERRAAPDAPAAAAPTRVLLIHGLQRFRALRRPDNEFDFSAAPGQGGPRPDQLFATLLNDGPGVGIHTLAWCDTLAALNRTLDRATIRAFDGRVLMQVSAADSSALIDSPVAGLIGPNRAILFSEEQGTIEKFVPYGLE